MGDQRWYAAKGQQPRLRLLAAWRLDDPAGEVGVETLIVADESGPEPVVYQVPLTYRGEPPSVAQTTLSSARRSTPPSDTAGSTTPPTTRSTRHSSSSSCRAG
jgi:hypothetical protein